ncbi:MAG: hypothetical protein QJR14_05610 [Bacillota bacterium]|nr:hypothetical protein [Bacillota bacterium]
MRMAAVIDEQWRITRLPDGSEIVLFDTESGRVEIEHNRGHDLEKDRRPTTVRQLVEMGADVVCVVPEALCDRSYQQAREAGIRFLDVEEGTPWQEVLDLAHEGALHPHETTSQPLFRPRVGPQP